MNNEIFLKVTIESKPERLFSLKLTRIPRNNIYVYRESF